MDSAQQETDFSITLTKAALGEMRNYADEDNSKYFRLMVSPGGCSGFKYDFSMINAPEAEDMVFEQENGVALVVDPFSSMYLNGTLIHFTKTMMESGFTFQNPNSTAKCGCGSSFSA